MSKKEDKESLFCSFCGKSQKEVKQLIAEQLLLFLEERKGKDFKPMQKLNKFKL